MYLDYQPFHYDLEFKELDSLIESGNDNEKRVLNLIS